ncbi:metallophosphoesterase [Geothrix sp. PMB-07]|uniref:metallophosphoesterase family protein n=1 Tax=Geothrix sp. PMB-07 TaxID=3068640 RepID=UPI00274203B9|nr:metallophosphoesterase [Geothrix sp. PMB-07]WLT31590.1 metallophosphoesterase [Geothrix sp. PMB-07]
MIKRLALLLSLACFAGSLSATDIPVKKPAAAPAPKVKVALWGDSRENLDQATEQIASVLLSDITDWDVQVHSGDFTHRGGEKDWQRTLQVKGIDKLFVKGRFLLSTSNHDCDENQTPECRAVYDKYTKDVLPTNSLNHTTHFYAWDKGNVHIVFCDGFFTDAATMQTWLDGYLKTVPKGDWLIGVWHDPAYGITYKENYLATCGPWLKALHEHGAKFVMNGHAHVYVRTKPMLPDGTLDAKSGIVHLINGTGGASWKDPIAPDAKIAFTPTVRSFPCITFLTFEGDTATLQTVDARPGSKLKVIDEFKWTK